jgi:hypothetical protein
MSLDAYRHVRSEPTWFFVRPDHVQPEVEVVVERAAGYWIVQKVGIAGEIARALGPDR